MEEAIDDLAAAAGALGLLGIPAFVFQEGLIRLPSKPTVRSHVFHAERTAA